jgi:CDP-glycerol glycerophosphotransferase (TagB/SpsB family)
VNLNANKVRIGSTKAIKSGSPFIPPDFCLPPNFSKEKILFTSIWTEKSNINWHRKNLEIIKEWIQEHIEYKLFIKLHPIENPSLINSMFGEISNVEILDRSISLKDALKEVSLVVSSWSNATIEAAVLNRPSIVIDYSDLRDNNLRIEEYFLPRAKNPEELQNRIDTIFTNYESYLNSCKAYAQYHLEYTTHSLSYMSSCLKSIIEGREDFPYSFVEEDLSVLLGSKLVDCK